MTKNNKLYKNISIGAIASIMINKIIRRISDIDLIPDNVKIFLLVIALIFGAIYWYKKDKSVSGTP